MLLLSKGLPAFQTVPLGKDSAIVIRAATAFEVDKAAAGAGRMLAGLVVGSDASAAVIGMIGEEFAEPDFANQQWREAAAQRLALLELADLCTERLIGVGDESGLITGKPNKGQLALLLRDTECARRISEAIRAKVHDEVAEGNGLPASPDGAAKAGDATAPSVDATIFPALPAEPALTGSSAPK